VVEGLDRLQQPEPLVVGPLAVAAAAGIAINLLSARFFGADSDLDLNRRAAVLHLLSDAAVSAAVLLSAILVALTGRTELDAITAIAVGAAVMVSAYGLLNQALAASLDAVPEGQDLQLIEAALRGLPRVMAVSELHVWGLGGRRVALTAHLQVQSVPAADLLRLGEERLRELGIEHSTLQIEPMP